LYSGNRFSTQHDARQRSPALIVLKEENNNNNNNSSPECTKNRYFEAKNGERKISGEGVQPPPAVERGTPPPQTPPAGWVLTKTNPNANPVVRTSILHKPPAN